MSRIVVITGVSSGIGRDSVRKLLQEGYNIISTVRNETDRQEVLNSYPDNHKCIICDITKDEELDKFIAELDSQLDGRKIFALINNAGIAIPGPMHLLPDDKFFKQMDVNLIATRKITNRLIPKMASEDSSNRPKIIFISSVSGIIASAFNGAYCVSKHALECLIDVYRRELYFLGIDVVSIQPGPIKTRIWSKVMGSYDQYKGTEFHDIAQKADKIIQESERNALDVSRVSDCINSILRSNKPKLRYLIHKRPFMIRLIGHWLPASWLDKMMWKTLGNKDSKKYRPI